MAKYELLIKVDGLSSTKEEKNKEQLQKINTPEKNNQQQTDSKEIQNMSKSIGAMAGVMALQEGKKLISQSVDTYVSTIGARTDNIARQNQIENIVKSGEKTLEMVGTVAAGALLGTKVAPGVGTVVGAAVALIGSLTSEAITAISNAKQYDREQYVSSLQAAKSSERIEAITTQRR